MSITYKQQLDQLNNAKVIELISDFPGYAKDYFNHIHSSASRTKISYAYNIRTFFNWLIEFNPVLKNKEYKNISINIIDSLEVADIDEYLAYMSTINTPAGMAQKISSLNSMFKYLNDSGKIKQNPVAAVKRVKVEDKPIVKLSSEQMSSLLDTIEYGWENMTEHQKVFWERDKVRDLAIIMIMLSTGIRVSECVGLNLDDINTETCELYIVRKGHKERQVVYFSDEAKESVMLYLDERKKIQKKVKNDSKDALFLSARYTRLGVQSIEDIVKKYTKYAGFGDKYTPHKLRKTFGTELYNNTGDIYLVATALGHEDVATTTKHYVEENMKELKRNRNIIHMRENKEE